MILLIRKESAVHSTQNRGRAEFLVLRCLFSLESLTAR
ncbi:hypothetical protein T4D_4181 [Trichinella pseudospiralis]|uniref:Uncharacterized protein n=1 Tax=Trichinella pseudospiralis TaxID=6337 RepID=A0A0V1DQF1_TRIPS|nr:hypothetical protein T4D_4181 [Trichinella pseudospiralis]